MGSAVCWVPIWKPVDAPANASGLGLFLLLDEIMKPASADGTAALPDDVLIVHRASCTVVRFYVAKFSASAAETWARSHGATDAEIEAARRCLKDAPAQTAQAAHWTAQ
jgi:hypothetical protein